MKYFSFFAIDGSDEWHCVGRDQVCGYQPIEPIMNPFEEDMEDSDSRLSQMLGPLNSFRDYRKILEEQLKVTATFDDEHDLDIQWEDDDNEWPTEWVTDDGEHIEKHNENQFSKTFINQKIDEVYYDESDEEEADNPELLRYRGKRSPDANNYADFDSDTKIIPAHRGINAPPQIGLKLAGGSQAKPNSWPFMSILWISNFETNETYFCGATIIDNFWLVTAGHCAYLGEKFEVVVGEHDLKTVDGRENRFEVDKVIVHPDFINNIDLPNDIALVLLARPIIYTDFIQPACISDRPPPFEAEFSSCVTLGWGWTRFNKFAQFLRQGSMELIKPRECQNRFWSNYKVLKSTFCAGNLQSNACSGDSGGPLMCLDLKTGKYLIHGIISWGDTACRRGQSATVFTRIDLYNQWIEREKEKYTSKSFC